MAKSARNEVDLRGPGRGEVATGGGGIGLSGSLNQTKRVHGNHTTSSGSCCVVGCGGEASVQMGRCSLCLEAGVVARCAGEASVPMGRFGLCLEAALVSCWGMESRSFGPYNNLLLKNEITANRV